jgi:hypothetical protein
VGRLREFVESYRRSPGGALHRLVVAFNGFESEAELSDYREALGGIRHESLFVRPPAQDIPAYFEAARSLECEHLCFLNSHSRLIDPEWLGKMYEHAAREDVGVVGATGSWQSGYSFLLFQQGRPSAYTGLLDGYYCPDAAAKSGRFGLSEELLAHIRRKPFHRRLVSWPYCVAAGAAYSMRDRVKRRKEARAMLREYSVEFEPFPARHLRTNAFMIRRELMLRLRLAPITSKHDAHRFESGKEGMTSQVLRAGLRALVVGRDGRAYEPDRWHLSETLWQGEQRNLLVSDNQTDDYARGGPRRRVFLSRVAWGDKALPSASPRARDAETSEDS